MNNNNHSFQELEQYNTEVQHLLTAKNPQARSLLSFIQRNLRQFNLDGSYHEIEIFNTAYLRGTKLIQSGTPIGNPKAWLKTTALNIIRELSRNKRRFEELAKNFSAKLDISPIEHIDNLVDENLINQDINYVMAALKTIPSKDWQILELRIIKGLSWEEVGQELVKLGEKPLKNAALRKSGQRALERFRKAYHEQRPSSTSDFSFSDAR